MMNGIRNAFSKGILRLVLILLMGMLVASFAIWGIGDIFRGRTNTTVATVGDAKISAITLQQNYNRELQRLSRMTGRQITPEQARQFGIDRRVLGQMMTEATIDQAIDAMNLGMSDEALKAHIFANPAFKDTAGRFDPNRFADKLREENLSEAGYLDVLRKQALRGQVVNALGGGVTAPKTFLDLVKRYQGETRTADYLLLTKAQAGEVPAPTDEQFAGFFERRKAMFRAPEFRKITVVSATPADLAGFVSVADEKVNAEFERLRGNLERRTVQQIRFADKAAAEAALARLKAGTTFDALAEEMKLKPADLDLGTVSRGELVDAKIREAAFTAKEGEPSGVIEGTFGPVIVRVTQVIAPDPARIKEEIRVRLARDGAVDEANRLANALEKERASGLPLADIAAKVGANAQVIDEVDAQGKDSAGSPVLVPGGQDVITAAFRTDVGVENDPLQPRGGGYIWYEVSSLAPARERKLDEVKEAAATAWQNDEVRARLVKKAGELIAEMKGGKTLADVAAAQQLALATTKPMLRQANDGDWSNAAVQMLFATPLGKPATIAAADGIDQLVFVTKEVTPPKDEPAPRTQAELTQAYESDLVDAYIGRLQATYGTSINQTLFQRATGGGDPTQ